MEASRLSVFIYLVPTLGMIWGFVYLDEPITLWIILGAAMILIGVWINEQEGGVGSPSLHRLLDQCLPALL